MLNLNIYYFPTLKEMGMCQKKRANLQINLTKWSMNFRLALKTSNPINNYLKYFFTISHRHWPNPHDIQKEPKCVEINLSDLYCIYLDHDQHTNFKKFKISEMARLAQLSKMGFSEIGFIKSPYRLVIKDELVEN